MALLYDKAMNSDLDRVRLESRRDTLLEQLSRVGNLMRGSLYINRVRCGRASCECATGEKHAQVHLSVNVKGRTRKVYVGERREGEVSALIAEYHRAWRIIQELTEINLELLRPARKRKATKGERKA